MVKPVHVSFITLNYRNGSLDVLRDAAILGAASIICYTIIYLDVYVFLFYRHSASRFDFNIYSRVMTSRLTGSEEDFFSEKDAREQF